MTDKRKNSIQKRVIQGAAIVIFAALIMRIIGDESHWLDNWLDNWLGTDGGPNAKYQTLKSLALGLAGLVGLLGWLASNQRANAMTDSVDAQVKDNEKKTFHEAIKHLGDSSASVRLGGIYALYDLALSNPEKRLKNIIEILSAHVRETTQEKKYQEKYEKKPSNEISSLIKLLSDLNKEYPNKEVKSSPLDLSDTYLCGVYLRDLDFSYAIFTSSNFAGANLLESNFAGADLRGSHFEGAFLGESHFAGANLHKSYFASANLLESHFEGAYDDQDESIGDFKKRIENRKGKKAEIGKTMIFAGGITEKYIKDLEKRLENTLPYFTDDDRRKEFKKDMNLEIEALKPHQGQPISHKIPEHLRKNNLLGELTEDRANEIIKEYEKFMKIHD